MADKLKVLFIEDDESLTFINKISLEREGFEVFHADNLREAKLLFTAKQPDIVWTDHEFPAERGRFIAPNGFNIIDFIKQSSRPQTKIIWWSGKIEIKLETPKEKGADFAFYKPAMFSEIKNALEQVKAELEQQQNR